MDVDQDGLPGELPEKQPDDEEEGAERIPLEALLAPAFPLTLTRHSILLVPNARLEAQLTSAILSLAGVAASLLGATSRHGGWPSLDRTRSGNLKYRSPASRRSYGEFGRIGTPISSAVSIEKPVMSSRASWTVSPIHDIHFRPCCGPWASFMTSRSKVHKLALGSEGRT